MHASCLLTALTAALASCSPLMERGAETGTTLSKRECYNSGESWGNSRARAKDLAWEVCKNGALASGPGITYKGYEVRSACRNLDSRRRVNFRIERLRGTSRTLDVYECYDGLWKEIQNCSRGGNTAYSNWKYK